VLAANLPLIGEHEEYQIVMRCTRGGNYQTDALAPGPATLIVQTPTFASTPRRTARVSISL
jgi:hypothetical protein